MWTKNLFLGSNRWSFFDTSDQRCSTIARFLSANGRSSGAVRQPELQGGGGGQPGANKLHRLGLSRPIDPKVSHGTPSQNDEFHTPRVGVAGFLSKNTEGTHAQSSSENITTGPRPVWRPRRQPELSVTHVSEPPATTVGPIRSLAVALVLRKIFCPRSS